MEDTPLGAERLAAFSDGVIAVIITLMVLELKPPDIYTFAGLAPLWPQAVSYAVSYLFIAIIWVNHHHLLRFVRTPTTRLIWWNFAHLFLVSLVPLATQWAARGRLAPAPVTLYAGVFVAVDLAYLAFEHEVLRQADCSAASPAAVSAVRRRALITLGLFASAMAVANWIPLVGMVLIGAGLSLFVRPEAPGLRRAPLNPALGAADVPS